MRVGGATTVQSSMVSHMRVGVIQLTCLLAINQFNNLHLSKHPITIMITQYT